MQRYAKACGGILIEAFSHIAITKKLVGIKTTRFMERS